MGVIELDNELTVQHLAYSRIAVLAFTLEIECCLSRPNPLVSQAQVSIHDSIIILNLKLRIHLSNGLKLDLEQCKRLLDINLLDLSEELA